MHNFLLVLRNFPVASDINPFYFSALSNQVCNEELTMEDPASHVDKKPEPECSEENLCIEPPTKKKKTDKKKKKKKKMVDIYSGLDVIEELDADTGEVRAMHSLASVSTTCPETLESTEPPVSLSVQMKANRVYGLVLVPTRELAIQVRSLKIVVLHLILF
ncbi:unnamed protein product [Trichobilharzia regenti]|nr:unnamed protein product [Trichobilharzia regenti]